jgi:hypothetical protein
MFILIFSSWRSPGDKLNNIKIPKTVITLIILIILGLIISLVIKPDFLVQQFEGLIGRLIKPITGRWNTTVAENKQKRERSERQSS